MRLARCAVGIDKQPNLRLVTEPLFCPCIYKMRQFYSMPCKVTEDQEENAQERRGKLMGSRWRKRGCCPPTLQEVTTGLAGSGLFF